MIGFVLGSLRVDLVDLLILNCLVVLLVGGDSLVWVFVLFILGLFVLGFACWFALLRCYFGFDYLACVLVVFVGLLF